MYIHRHVYNYFIFLDVQLHGPGGDFAWKNIWDHEQICATQQQRLCTVSELCPNGTLTEDIQQVDTDQHVIVRATSSWYNGDSSCVYEDIQIGTYTSPGVCDGMFKSSNLTTNCKKDSDSWQTNENPATEYQQYTVCCTAGNYHISQYRNFENSNKNIRLRSFKYVEFFELQIITIYFINFCRRYVKSII